MVVEAAAPESQETPAAETAPVITVSYSPAAAAVTPPVVEEPAVTEPAKAAEPVAVQPAAEVKPAAIEAKPVAVIEPEATTDPAWEKMQAAYKAGKLPEYLKVVSTDYDKMDAEAILKAELQKQYPKADSKALNVLYNNKLKRDFGLESFDEDGNEDGRILLGLEVDKIRDGFKAEQSQYQIPTQPPVDPQVQRMQEQQLQIQKEAEEILQSHPVLRAFEMKPVIQLGDGEEKFNFTPDASLNTASILNPGRMIESMFWSENPTTKKMEFDMETYIKVRNYASNPKKVETELINYGKTLGAKQEFDGLTNPSTSGNGKTAPVATGQKITVRRD